jgi:hypothetical protein
MRTENLAFCRPLSREFIHDVDECKYWICWWLCIVQLTCQDTTSREQTLSEGQDLIFIQSISVPRRMSAQASRLRQWSPPFQLSESRLKPRHRIYSFRFIRLTLLWDDAALRLLQQLLDLRDGWMWNHEQFIQIAKGNWVLWIEDMNRVHSGSKENLALCFVDYWSSSQNDSECSDRMIQFLSLGRMSWITKWRWRREQYISHDL